MIGKTENKIELNKQTPEQNQQEPIGFETGQRASAPAVMIAATGSGCGKTTITCALLGALKNMGLDVHSYKCGPDYIDPLFHESILGVPSGNLDLFFTGEEKTRSIYLNDNPGDLAVIEGVMGLYDGISAASDEGSSYHLARVLGLPVILVVDARGMSRSVLALIRGFLDMDESRLIRGVILNRISESLFGSLKPLIEEELGVKVLGYYPRVSEGILESRYLGLKLPHEIQDIKEQGRRAAEYAAASIDLAGVLELAETACAWGPLDSEGEGDRITCGASTITCGASTIYELDNDGLDNHHFCIDHTGKNPLRIAIARDEAFCFYYHANLRMLEAAGAQLVEFSPIYDKALPEGISGLILGGGYPELFGRQLQANEAMRLSIRTALENGLPSLAECGGFMYLHESITDQAGQSWEMAGLLKGTCSYTGKLVRFGYMEINDRQGSFLPSSEMKVRGHEFHYFDSSCNGDDGQVIKPSTGRRWQAAHIGTDHWWGFAHLYYPSCPDFPSAFINACSRYRTEG